ncbi:NAD-dependent epimerase/dehydratase family protein [Rhodobacter lacus]|uniref:NAD-dependent epimerase/dehydratase family protein n=1 Tax=Rhodobacter lacus TaxID=1641972 RepID=A0ABW5A891_9RHOB
MSALTIPRAALITGAGGFIGGHLSRYLSARGCEVRGIGHSAMSREECAALGISKWYSGGIGPSALKETCAGAEIIYHCAGSGSVPLSLQEPMTDFRSNVVATADVLEFSREAGGIPVVYLSTAGVYGKADKMPICIDDPFRPVSPYGMNKLTGEALMRQYGTFFNVPGTILRLFSVYGEGLRKQLLWDASQKLHRGDQTFFGTGNETRDWIHVSDAVTLITRIGACASPQMPVFHGANGEAVRIRTVLERLAACYDVPTPIQFNGQGRPGDPSDYHADVTASLALGWQPEVALDDGIACFADWFRRDMAATSMAAPIPRGRL